MLLGATNGALGLGALVGALGAGADLGAGVDCAGLGAGVDCAGLAAGVPGLGVELDELAWVPSNLASEAILPYKNVVTCIIWLYHVYVKQLM